jgi:hypothetical protein
MKNLMTTVQLVVVVVGLSGLGLTTAGCETRARVVAPAPAVRVYAPPPPVVQERVIIR